MMFTHEHEQLRRTVERFCRSDGGASVSTRATMAWAVGPVKGGSPASISYTTQPSA